MFDGSARFKSKTLRLIAKSLCILWYLKMLFALWRNEGITKMNAEFLRFPRDCFRGEADAWGMVWEIFCTGEKLNYLRCINITQIKKPNVKNGTERIKTHLRGKDVQSIQKEVIKEVLPDLFHVGFGETNTGFKNVFYYFVKGVLTKMTDKYPLNAIFEINSKSRTQPSSI